MDLWVGVEVTHTLDVHHNQLVAGTLKGEVAEGLWGDMKEKVTTRDQAVGCTNAGRQCSERFQHPTSAHVGGLYLQGGVVQRQRQRKEPCLIQRDPRSAEMGHGRLQGPHLRCQAHVVIADEA